MDSFPTYTPHTPLTTQLFPLTLGFSPLTTLSCDTEAKSREEWVEQHNTPPQGSDIAIMSPHTLANKWYEAHAQYVEHDSGTLRRNTYSSGQATHTEVCSNDS